MNKKKDISGLIFSAFLVIAYVICSYFFIGIITSSTGMDSTVKLLLRSIVFVFFGLILFYATRVGDGKQVKRFSLAALLLLDLPALYMIVSACAVGLPFPLDLASVPETVSIAAVALGYGIPYTFLSGYELNIPKEETEEKPTEESAETSIKEALTEEADVTSSVEADKSSTDETDDTQQDDSTDRDTAGEI